jgi:hypothetical protein
MNNTLSKNQLMQEAILLTSEMRTSYPELYKFLDETTLFLSNKNGNQISTSDFEKYLQTLKAQLRNYIGTRLNIMVLR